MHIETFKAKKTNARRLALIFLSCTRVDQAIQGQLAPEKEESMTIKLPDARELRTVANDLERIEKALSQVVNHPSIDGKVEVNTWEPGSLWIEIYLGTMAAVSIVASIAWSAAVISKKRHEAQIIAESVRGLAIKATSLEDLCEAQRSMIELQIESEAKALCADSGSDLDRILRLQFAIKEFASLIDRGAEVHPALMAPESVKNLFPANLNPLAIESKIHRIENSAPSLDE